jgi:hypothetical protein
LLAQIRQRSVTHQPRAAHVDVHHGVPRIDRQLVGELAARVGDCRVVDQCVEPAELRHGLIGKLPDAVGISEIERQIRHRVALLDQRRRKRAAFVMQDVAEHDLRTGLHQRANERRAEAARAAGHEDAPVFECRQSH